MVILVVGCGRVGAELAYRLERRGHQVTVVDQVASAFERLHPEFRGRTVEGEVLSREVLQRAGIERADGLAAVTNSDSINAALVHVARQQYHVPNCVVRNYDPRCMPLHEAFGAQVVSSSIWGAQRIEELLHGSVGRCVFSAGNGEVEIYELPVPESWDGRRVREVLPECGCLAAALTRAGRAVIPEPETALASGDVLLLIATRERIEDLRKRLPKPRQEEGERCSS